MKASIVVVSITFLFMAVLAVGWMWMKPKYDDMMFEPTSDYQLRTQSVLEIVFPEAVASIDVFRVDRALAASFFTIELSEEQLEAGAKIAAKKEIAFIHSPEASPPSIRMQFDEEEPSRNFLVLERISKGRWYGGHQLTSSLERFKIRYEENRRLIE